MNNNSSEIIEVLMEEEEKIINKKLRFARFAYFINYVPNFKKLVYHI